jgi:hypothetical protein
MVSSPSPSRDVRALSASDATLDMRRLFCGDDTTVGDLSLVAQ